MNCVILRFTEKIFLTDYSGIKILMTHYFKAMEQILFTENFSKLNQTSIDTLLTVISDSDYDKSKEPLLSVLTILKNSAIKILKSILFFGYSLGDLKLAGLPEAKMERAKPTMKLVREEIFRMVYRLLDKMRKVKPKTGKLANFSEYYDVEFQYNILTLAALIIQLESQAYKPNTTIIDISIEVHLPPLVFY